MTSAGAEDPFGPLPTPDEPAWASAADDGLLADARREGFSRRRLRMLAAVLAVLLAAACALATFFWIRSSQWADYATSVESDTATIGEELAQLRSEHEGTLAELRIVQEQLAASQQRVSELAAEKAALGDDREAQRQLADYQERISTAAGSVATSLNECINRQQQLLGYLDDASAYDPNALAQFRDQVNSLCASAATANQALQQELTTGATGTDE